MTEITTNKSGGGMGKMLLIVIILIVAIGAGWYFFSGKTTGISSNVVDSSKYQAVFLTNGQVYFGKVSGEQSQYVSVADVYYMVLKQPLQNQKKEGEEQAQEQTKPEYSIVKLGKEMHGPTSMAVNRDQILFIENLADDSKVVSAIKTSANQK